MLLSIIIPAYNEETYIGQCLDAVMEEIKNTDERVEVIVVNNASTDRTREIVADYKDVLLVDEHKKGITHARQAGFMASSGALIANIDADTKMPKGWIKRVLTEFEHDSKLVALSGPYIYYDFPPYKKMLVAAYYRLAYLLHRVNQLFDVGCMLIGGNCIVRRDALDKIGGFNKKIEFYGEDVDLARRVQKVGKLNFTMKLPMPTSARRLSGEGMLTMGLRYAMNNFWMAYFHKPFTKTYKDIR